MWALWLSRSPAWPVSPPSCPLLCVSGCPGLGRCAAPSPWCWRAPSGCWALLWSSPPAAAPSPGPAADAATLEGGDNLLVLYVFHCGYLQCVCVCVCEHVTCCQSLGGARWLDHLSLLADQHLLHAPQLAGRHCVHLTQPQHVLHTQTHTNTIIGFPSLFWLIRFLLTFLCLLSTLYFPTPPPPPPPHPAAVLQEGDSVLLALCHLLLHLRPGLLECLQEAWNKGRTLLPLTTGCMLLYSEVWKTERYSDSGDSWWPPPESAVHSYIILDTWRSSSNDFFFYRQQKIQGA